MKQWKTWQIALFSAFCLLLNYGGRSFASHYQLPVWLDNLGTALIAYVGGPVCGAIIGVAGNAIFGMMNHISHIYGLASLAFGIIVGFSAKKGRFETFFGTTSVSALTAVITTIISVPLNLTFYNGSTGNIWGNGVAGYLGELGYPRLLRVAVGELYVDFADKLLTLVTVFILLKALRLIVRKKGEDPDFPGTDGQGRGASLAVLAAIVGGACLLLGQGKSVGASEQVPGEIIDYNDYVQTIYSSNNGLPCGEANDIAMTRDGILWIGTYAGLYRYNGSEFKWMDSYDSVRNVNCLYVDAEGRLWIGTNDNGLSIVIHERVVNVIDESLGLPSNSVRCITQSSDGYYYIGTTSSLQIVMLNSGLKRVSTIREMNFTDELAADEDGHVAAVTSDGRLFVLKKGQIISSLQLVEGAEHFTCCAFDKDGRVLAGTTENHIYAYDISQGFFDLKDTYVCEGLSYLKNLHQSDEGELFITADSGGVGYFDTDGFFRTVNVNSFDNSIDNMLMDYQGNLWFTSSRLGLLRLAPSAFRDVYSTAGMESRVVNAVTYWRDAFYFGTDKGLDMVDPTCRIQQKNDLTARLEGIRIRCLLADSHGSLWICTYGQGLWEALPDGSVNIYDSDNGAFGNRARVAIELSDGTIVAGGQTGISFIRDHQIVKTLFRSDGLTNPAILTLTELDDGRVLAGTDGDGIAILDDMAVSGFLNRDDGLSSGVILRTVRDTKGQGVFIVTSNGLCYLDVESESIRSIRNFPYYNNYDIWAKDKETLFVMSSAGIYVVSRDELAADKAEMAYELLDFRLGLNSALTANSWNYHDDHGDLFLPCDQGVFIIDTGRYTQGIRSYRMSIPRVKLDNDIRTLDRSSQISVSRGVSRIEFFPEVINYTIEDPNVGYYLEGFDNGWTRIPQSSLGTIVYTNLPTGTYTFHLAVFDSEGVEIIEERVYTLVKEKEIYDNRYFGVYMVAIGMLGVAWLTWFIARTQIQRTLNFQKRELEIARQEIQMGNETIVAIARAVDAKDESTSQHSQRVSEYSYMIAKEMGLSQKECEDLRKAAQMHDIGKIGIPDRILNKPGRLTDEEYAVMKSHVTRGADILKDFTLIAHVVEGARYHHERYDGRGYPEGLKGEEIPLFGRIIGVADAFDAMTANRVYRQKMDFGYVLGEMERGRGTQFDPKIVDILLRLINEGKIDVERLYADTAKAGAEAARKEETAAAKAPEQEAKGAASGDEKEKSGGEG